MKTKSNSQVTVTTLSDRKRKRLLERLQKTIWWSGALPKEHRRTPIA